MLIDKEEPKDNSRDLFFGILLIKGAVERIAKIFNPFPISTSISQMIESSKINSKPTIRYMTPEEEMRYLISTKNGK